ncbi:MAG: HAMP domain-containing sensor histidine kinase [Phycisphaerae bacterium]
MKSFLKQVFDGSRGLQFRATFLLTVLVASATGLTGVMYRRISAAIAFDRAAQQARELVRCLAASCPKLIAESDRDGLLQIVNGLVGDERVAYVAFTDVTGGVLACTQLGAGNLSNWLNASGTSLRFRDLDRPILLNDARLGPRLDIVYPVRDAAAASAPQAPPPVVGFVRLGLSLAPEDRMLMGVSRQVEGIAIGIALLMVPVGFLLVRGIVRPLEDLAGAAHAIAGGDLSTRVAATRGDEIGRLQRSFNSMADDLSVSRSALEALNAELEERVAKRTIELRVANHQLHVEIEEREELTRAVSHDLQAPLRNIAGQVLLMKKKIGNALPAPARHAADRIEHNVRYEMAMIDELIELSRVRTTREPPHWVDSAEKLRKVAAPLEFEMKRKHIELRIDPGLPTLLLEPMRMRQLFQNLLDNAVKYTPEPRAGGDVAARPIRVSYTATDDEHVFRFADRGIGVRPGDRQAIFRLFSRARSEFVSNTPGRGVGLSYCKSIVDRWRGRIWVDEHPGGGSIFCVALPRAVVPDRAPTTPPVQSRQPAEASHA